MADDSNVPDWRPDAVLRRLEAETADPDAPVSVQLFLSENVPPADIEGCVRSAVAEAAAASGAEDAAVELGRPLKLARSISLAAPLRVLKGLMARDEFVALLPSNLQDVLVRPVSRKES